MAKLATNQNTVNSQPSAERSLDLSEASLPSTSTSSTRQAIAAAMTVAALSANGVTADAKGADGLSNPSQPTPLTNVVSGRPTYTNGVPVSPVSGLGETTQSGTNSVSNSQQLSDAFEAFKNKNPDIMGLSKKSQSTIEVYFLEQMQANKDKPEMVAAKTKEKMYELLEKQGEEAKVDHQRANKDALKDQQEAAKAQRSADLKQKQEAREAERKADKAKHEAEKAQRDAERKAEKLQRDAKNAEKEAVQKAKKMTTLEHLIGKDIPGL